MNPENQTPPLPQSAPQESNPVPIAEPPKPKSNSLIITLSVSLIVMVGVVAFLAYQNWQLQKQVTSLQIIPSPTLTTTIDSTADWQDLTRTIWTLKIPNTWHYLECNPGNTLFIDPNQIHEDDNQTVECNFGPSAKIWISKIENDQPIPTPFVVNNTTEDSKSETLSLEISDKEQFILDNKTGVIQKETYHGGPNEGTTLSVYIKDKGISYVMSLSDLSLKDTFLKILSTFKFLGQGNASTIPAKYSNSQYGFSFEYPTILSQLSSTEGGISSPFTGNPVELLTLADKTTIENETDKPFNGVRLDIVDTNGSFDTYVSGERDAEKNSPRGISDGTIQIFNGTVQNYYIESEQSIRRYFIKPTNLTNKALVLSVSHSSAAFLSKVDEILSSWKFSQ